MPTILQIGPHDHGREMTYGEFVAADYEAGYKYELIDGEIYVSPRADSPHDVMAEYVHELLLFYKSLHPNLVKRLSQKAQVFVPGRRETTCSAPDLAIYQDHRPDLKIQWQDVSPFIVVEIVSKGDPDKDYVRNVELYREVESILEYWVFDKLEEEGGPVLKVYRRDADSDQWLNLDYGPQDVYRTPLLRGFALPVTPN